MIMVNVLIRRIIGKTSGLAIPRQLSESRQFTISSMRSITEDKERSPQELEAKKQEQLQKQKEGKGHWHEELASSSESNVTADRVEVDDHGQHMEELQHQGKKKGEKGEL